MNFSIMTFGCKTNQSESNNIISSMINNGYDFCKEIFDKNKKLDVVIVNTCTVTSESDRKLRQFVNRIKSIHPSAVVVLVGCFPQAFPDKVRGFQNTKDIQIVLGNSQKYNIPAYLKEYFKSNTKIFDVKNVNLIKNFEDSLFVCDSVFNNKIRAFVKIQDGCDRFCSYCIIPYARGRVRSRSITSIKSEIEVLCKNNYKEIVLTGINLMYYGKDFDYKNNISQVVNTVCNFDFVKRVRLGSLEPDLVTSEFIDNISKHEKVCPHFHMSLQSGSNKILKRMNRLYTREKFLDKISLVKNKIPDAVFTTDLIVGFPGETEADFQDSLDIISKVNFLKTHVFPYSKRTGTVAADCTDHVSNEIKSERVQRAVEISKKNTRIILESFVNNNLEVLFETCDSDGFYRGYAKNYVLVKQKSSKNIIGEILKTRILNLQNDCLIGHNNNNNSNNI